MNQADNRPLDRRPIVSRNTRWAEQIAQRLVDWGVSPNAISMAGMFAAILAAFCFVLTNSAAAGWQQRTLWFIGAALCQVRLLCNLFDGMVAVARGTASRRGELYNEVPDRISDAAIFIGLGYSAIGSVALGYLAALVTVFVAYVRAMAKSVGAPNDFCGPMAKPQRMALVTLLAVYLSFSPIELRLETSEVNLLLVIVVVGGIFTSFRRLVRAARFLQGGEP